MAQGGEHGGKAVLSPAAWDKLHLNPVVRYQSVCLKIPTGHFLPLTLKSLFDIPKSDSEEIFIKR